MTGTTVRPASWRDVGMLSRRLSDAFQDDPLYGWMFGGQEVWRQKDRQFFRLLLRVHLRDGRVFTTSDLAGAALWSTPDLPYGGPFTQLVLPLRMRRLFAERAEKVRREIGELNAARPAKPHWYLPVLGVAPDRQRSGIGTALLHPVLDRCDGTGHPAYLETSVPANIPFYERLGFAVCDEMRVEDGPQVWGMAREPGAG